MTTEVKLVDEVYDYSSLSEFTLVHSPTGWSEFFTSLTPDIKTISDYLAQRHKRKAVILPPIEMIYTIFYRLPVSRIRIVILGMDPYHNPGAANGIAFSVAPGKTGINPSLRNIMREVENCGFPVDHSNGDLGKWVDQGVFLVNTALTVEQSNPGFHTGVWPSFSMKLVKHISSSSENKGIVWLLFGAKAHQFERYLPGSNTEKNVIIKTSHPSPQAAYTTGDGYDSFIKSRCFEKANTLLVEKFHLNPIDWEI